jgi:cell division protein FtsI (penicillin-binding protein 3)
MARHLKLSVDDARDTASVFIPSVKKGDALAANYVLRNLQVKDYRADDYKASGKAVPDVTGMGARDAVYLLESKGIKTKLKGRGKVKAQSIYAGQPIKQGMVCELTLE